WSAQVGLGKPAHALPLLPLLRLEALPVPQLAERGEVGSWSAAAASVGDRLGRFRVWRQGWMMNWNEYFMGMAVAASAKSKDPSSKVGAVIVDADRRIVSIGFNGPPCGTDDVYAYSSRDTKLKRVLHAEENAILFAGR